MKLSSPTSLLLNLGHAMDHWVLAIFLYTVSVIAGVWGADWKELTPYAFGASFMFGAGSIVSGKLGDQWGRRAMMVLFFAGMGVSSLVIALCQNKWQIGAALTVMGAFASIYHPVGIPDAGAEGRQARLRHRRQRPGWQSRHRARLERLGPAGDALRVGRWPMSCRA
jgi:MFS family permease